MHWEPRGVIELVDWIQKYKSPGRETNKESGVVMKPGRGLSITGVMDKLGCCDEEHRLSRLGERVSWGQLLQDHRLQVSF